MEVIFIKQTQNLCFRRLDVSCWWGGRLQWQCLYRLPTGSLWRIRFLLTEEAHG